MKKLLFYAFLIFVSCSVNLLCLAENNAKENTIILDLTKQSESIKIGKIFKLYIVIQNKGESDVAVCSDSFFGPYVANYDNKILNLKAQATEEILIDPFPSEDKFFVLKPGQQRIIKSFEYNLEEGTKIFNEICYEGYFLGFNDGYYFLGDSKQVRFGALYRVYEPVEKQAIKFGIQNLYKTPTASNKLIVNIED